MEIVNKSKHLNILASFSYEIFFETEMKDLLQDDNKIELLLVASNAVHEHSMSAKKLNTDKWIVECNNLHFFNLFRMEKPTFVKLVDAIGTVDVEHLLSKPYTGGHYPINIDSQLLVCLWYMATQDSLFSIGTRFKISPTTVMNIINKLLYFLIKLKKKYIVFPKPEQELQNTSRGFKNYPG